MSTPAAADRPAPRSLADALRARSDEALVDLLRLRPDLTVPLPPDLTALAARAGSRASVQRALDGLDAPTLQVVEVLAVLPEPTTPGEVTRGWGAAASPVLDRLRTLGLVWGASREVILVRAARDVLGAHPAGLGPPLTDTLDRRSPRRINDLLADLGLPTAADPEAAADLLTAHLGRPEVLADLLAGAPDGVRALLDRLTWGPPVGSVSRADRHVRAADAVGPVDWLLAHGLLAVADAGHVVLPREIGLALRGGRVHRLADLVPPPLHAAPPDADARERAGRVGAGAAAEAVRLVERLGEVWGEAPAPVLRAGGLGVRELRRTATALEVTDDVAALVMEVAAACGLVADDGEADPRWTPTPAFDHWSALDVGRRWTALVRAWAATTRCAHLVGTKDARGATRAPLGGDLDRPAAPGIRRWVLTQLADHPGEALDRAALIARLDWTTPRLSGVGRSLLVEGALAEAAWLGVTGAGVLTPAGAALLAPGRSDLPAAAGSAGPASSAAWSSVGPALPESELAEAEDRAAAVVRAALPAPVDHILLQGDLTAVAPGPLDAGLGRAMGLLADVESRGGATVYRFTTGTVRRALDAGMSGDDVLDLLGRHSRTPVPQALAYLVQDTARRHGRIRIGAAQSYVRADDEAVIAELLLDRRAAALRLRRLAPTVLAAQAPPATVLATVRSMGLAPMAETPDGDVVLQRPAAHRTPARTPPRPVSAPPAPPDDVLLAAVRALRTSDEARTARAAQLDRIGAGLGPPPPLETVDPVNLLVALREAVIARTPVWIGHVDGAGQPARLLVDPLQVDAGRVTAFDRTTGQVRTFSVHRLSGLAPAQDLPDRPDHDPRKVTR